MGGVASASTGSDKSFPNSYEINPEHDRIKNELMAQSFYSLIPSFQDTVSNGSVLLPQDRILYNEARMRAFNMDQRGFPFMIVQPRNVDDIVKSINFYREQILPTNSSITLCVSCGGHSSKCMLTGSFVIDMKHLNQVAINFDNDTVNVGGGTYIKEIDRALSIHHFAVPLGTYPVVGIGGMALGGGYGWLTRKYGLAVDYIVEVEVVTPSGEVVVANEKNDHKELLWACRGGGGNFGVVTRLTFRYVKLPSKCYGGFLTFFPSTYEVAFSILQKYDELIQANGFDISSSIVLPAGNSAIPTTWVHVGEAATIDEIKPFNDAKNLGGWLSVTLENSLKERSFHHDIQSMLVPFQTSGHIYVTIIPIGSATMPIPLDVLDILLQFTRMPLNSFLKKASVALITGGGAAEFADIDNTSTCIPEIARKARYLAIIEVHWRPEYGQQGKAIAREWAQNVLKILSPCKTVTLKYAPDEVQQLNEKGGDLGYSEAVYKKLQQVKTRYDPKNMFRNNLNIKPKKLQYHISPTACGADSFGPGSPFSPALAIQYSPAATHLPTNVSVSSSLSTISGSDDLSDGNGNSNINII